MHLVSSAYSPQSRLLAQNPEVQQRLRAECLSLPSYKAHNLPKKDELKNMSYLKNVIHEGPHPKTILNPTSIQNTIT